MPFITHPELNPACYLLSQGSLALTNFKSLEELIKNLSALLQEKSAKIPRKDRDSSLISPTEEVSIYAKLKGFIDEIPVQLRIYQIRIFNLTYQLLQKPAAQTFLKELLKETESYQSNGKFAGQMMFSLCLSRFFPISFLLSALYPSDLQGLLLDVRYNIVVNLVSLVGKKSLRERIFTTAYEMGCLDADIAMSAEISAAPGEIAPILPSLQLHFDYYYTPLGLMRLINEFLINMVSNISVLFSISGHGHKKAEMDALNLYIQNKMDNCFGKNRIIIKVFLEENDSLVQVKYRFESEENLEKICSVLNEKYIRKTSSTKSITEIFSIKNLQRYWKVINKYIKKTPLLNPTDFIFLLNHSIAKISAGQLFELVSLHLNKIQLADSSLGPQVYQIINHILVNLRIFSGSLWVNLLRASPHIIPMVEKYLTANINVELIRSLLAEKLINTSFAKLLDSLPISPPDSKHSPSSAHVILKKLDQKNTIYPQPSSLPSVEVLPVFSAAQTELLFATINSGSIKKLRELIKSSPIYLEGVTSKGFTALRLAVYCKKTELVKFLVPKMTTRTIIYPDCDGQTPLMAAAYLGNLEMTATITQAVDSTHIYKYTEKMGYSPLFAAVKEGHFSVVAYFLKRLSLREMNFRSKEGYSPLEFAIIYGRPDIVKLFHQRFKKDPESLKLDPPYTMGKTGNILGPAVDFDQELILVYLLENDPELLTVPADENQTALHAAIPKENDKMARLLIERGSIDYCKTQHQATGESPLMMAARLGKEELVKLLLKKSLTTLEGNNILGQNPILVSTIFKYIRVTLILLREAEISQIYAADIQGNTALHIAIGLDSAAIFFSILDRFEKAQVSTELWFLENMQGFTPLHVAAGMKPIFVKRLLPYLSAAQKCAVDSGGETALHSACDSEPETLQLLLNSQTADKCNIPNLDGYTPLHVAVATNNEVNIGLILDKLDDKQINVYSKFSGTAVHLALFLKKDKAIKTLLASPKVEVNAIFEGMSCLHYLVQQGNVEVLKIFLKHPRIIPIILDAQGYTPLQRARSIQPRNETIIDLLQVNEASYQIKNESGSGNLVLHSVVEPTLASSEHKKTGFSFLHAWEKCCQQAEGLMFKNKRDDRRKLGNLDGIVKREVKLVKSSARLYQESQPLAGPEIYNEYNYYLINCPGKKRMFIHLSDKVIENLKGEWTSVRKFLLNRDSLGFVSEGRKVAGLKMIPGGGCKLALRGSDTGDIRPNTKEVDYTQEEEAPWDSREIINVIRLDQLDNHDTLRRKI